MAPKIGPQLPPSFHRDEARGDTSDDEEGEVSERSLYEGGVGDFRGYYYDGAYTAAPDPEDEYYDDEEDPSAAAAEAYLAAIRARFLALRSRLHATPPAHLVSALPPTNTPHVGPFGPRSHAFAQWTRRLTDTDPLPAQVAAMDKDAALRVLRVVMGGQFLRVGREVTERTSRWVWALLARLPPAGELGHTEVGWVRDLGRRAVLLGRSLAEMAALRDEIAGGGGDLGVNDGVDESEEDEGVVQEYEGEDIYSEGETNRTGDEKGMDGEETADTKGGPSTDKNDEDAAGGKENGEALEEGEEPEDEDMPMDLEDEGEAQDEDLEAAKHKLLAQLGEAGTASPQGSAADEGDEATMRARMNMRATINVILTVAGEFYGQRDLLEFREPFTGM